MILILNHDEALNYLANLKPSVTETKLSETELTNANSKKATITGSKVYKPRKERQKITQEHMNHLFKIANEKCNTYSAIKHFASIYGYTLAYASSIVRKTEGIRLVKGRDIPMSDRAPNVSLIGKEQYVRKMI